MTVTQKELVALVEQDWHQQQQNKNKNRKVLEWSNDKMPESLHDISKESELPLPQKDDVVSDHGKSFNNDSSAFYEDIESI